VYLTIAEKRNETLEHKRINAKKRFWGYERPLAVRRGVNVIGRKSTRESEDKFSVVKPNGRNSEVGGS
jgi:hypothetical protein